MAEQHPSNSHTRRNARVPTGKNWNAPLQLLLAKKRLSVIPGRPIWATYDKKVESDGDQQKTKPGHTNTHPQQRTSPRCRRFRICKNTHHYVIAHNLHQESASLCRCRHGTDASLIVHNLQELLLTRIRITISGDWIGVLIVDRLRKCLRKAGPGMITAKLELKLPPNPLNNKDYRCFSRINGFDYISTFMEKLVSWEAVNSRLEKAKARATEREREEEKRKREQEEGNVAGNEVTEMYLDSEIDDSEAE
ncbi:hypothetical protein LOK49_LG07G01217 [Camellia lanceoleosa]|uniref:Uncharacterized protein n=1 Tax=Camellia lanceoleosa TaxID=1840588 RepID=A0ACC0H0R3_9ERIC|nr:hypothetical protein LOK49_LG07G01217 [Camellia lanceoleosa]